MEYDRWIGIDWSGAASVSDQHIYVAEACPTGAGREVTALSRATSREAVERWLNGERFDKHRRWTDRWPAPKPLERRERILVGLDFAFSFPKGFRDRTRRLSRSWQWAQLLRWSAQISNEPDIDNNLAALGFRLPRRGWDPVLSPEDQIRETERTAQQQGVAVSDVFNLVGRRQVGKGSIHGMAMLHRLCSADAVTVWPFNEPRGSSNTKPVIVEVFPGLWSGPEKSHVPRRIERIERWESEGLMWVMSRKLV